MEDWPRLFDEFDPDEPGARWPPRSPRRKTEVVQTRMFRFITAEGEIEVWDSTPVRPTEDWPGINPRYL